MIFFAVITASFLLLNFAFPYPQENLNNIAASNLQIRTVKVHVRKNKDGSCYSHNVVSGESCQFMMETFSISKIDLMKWIKNTFGWMGCDNGHPWAGDKVCVSDATPPIAPFNKLAERGPSKDGSDVKFPLNACRSQYGFCGLTSDFCTKTDSPIGSLGTTGCVSNCGYGKIHMDTRSDFKRIVYLLDSNDKTKTDPKVLKDYYTVHYSLFILKAT